MDFESVIKERFSARSFKDDMVEDEKIMKILEAGRIAPTAKNIQPQKIYVIKSKEGLAKIDKVSSCRFNAPVCLLVCSNKESAFKGNVFDTCVMDASIVATHMMLEATNLGLNNIWIELFDHIKIKEEFNIPEDIVPVCILDIGYKTEECHPSRLHDDRKPLSETVEFI